MIAAPLVGPTGDFDVGELGARVAIALAIVALAYVLVRLQRRVVSRWVRRASERRLAGVTDTTERARVQMRASTLGGVLTDVFRAVIWVLAFMTVLGQVGIEIAPLLAGAGIVGVAVGFGAQTLVRDYLSGFFILLEDQFGIGDEVLLDGTDDTVVGRVEDVTLRVTRLRGEDGTVWFVANGEIRRLGNRSRPA